MYFTTVKCVLSFVSVIGVNFLPLYCKSLLSITIVIIAGHRGISETNISPILMFILQGNLLKCENVQCQLDINLHI